MPRSVEHPKVPVAQLPSPVRQLPLGIVQPIEHDQIGRRGITPLREHTDHLYLEGIIEQRIHHLDAEAHSAAAGLMNQWRNLLEPTHDAVAIAGAGIACERGAEVFLQQHVSATACPIPHLEQALGGVLILRRAWGVVSLGEVVLHRRDDGGISLPGQLQ